jgi:predicted metal-dependent phosphoesterase TrpH
MHTSFSPDSLMKPEKLVSRCMETNLDCVAITDHNTIAGALEVQRMASFRVIIGEEIKSQGGEIIGLFLQETVPCELTSLETVQRIKEQGGLVSVPHPFDHFRRSVIDRQSLYEILPYVDIIEGFNARNTFQRDNRKAAELAIEHNIITSAVGDSHTLVEVGRTYVETPDFDGTPEGLRQALADGSQVRRPITPLIHVLTTLTKVRKRLWQNS